MSLHRQDSKLNHVRFSNFRDRHPVGGYFNPNQIGYRSHRTNNDHWLWPSGYAPLINIPRNKHPSMHCSPFPSKSSEFRRTFSGSYLAEKNLYKLSHTPDSKSDSSSCRSKSQFFPSSQPPLGNVHKCSQKSDFSEFNNYSRRRSRFQQSTHHFVSEMNRTHRGHVRRNRAGHRPFRSMGHNPSWQREDQQHHNRNSFEHEKQKSPSVEKIVSNLAPYEKLDTLPDFIGFDGTVINYVRTKRKRTPEIDNDDFDSIINAALGEPEPKRSWQRPKVLGPRPALARSGHYVSILDEIRPDRKLPEFDYSCKQGLVRKGPKPIWDDDRFNEQFQYVKEHLPPPPTLNGERLRYRADFKPDIQKLAQKIERGQIDEAFVVPLADKQQKFKFVLRTTATNGPLWNRTSVQQLIEKRHQQYRQKRRFFYNRRRKALQKANEDPWNKKAKPISKPSCSKEFSLF